MNLLILILGVFGSVASILGLYYLFRRVDKPEISLVEILDLNLTNEILNENTKISIKYGDEKINEDIFIRQLVLINSGQSDISVDDYEKIIVIQKSEKYEWLDVRLISKSKDLITDISINDGEVEFQKCLFKENEGISLELIGRGVSPKLDDLCIDYRIVNVAPIKKYKKDEKKLFKDQYPYLIWLASVLTIAVSLGVNKVDYDDIEVLHYRFIMPISQSDSLDQIRNFKNNLDEDLHKIGMTSIGYYIDSTLSFYPDDMTIKEVRRYQDSLTHEVEKKYPGYSIGHLFMKLDSLKIEEADFMNRNVIDRPSKEELKFVDFHKTISVNDDYDYLSLYRVDTTKQYVISSTATVNFELVDRSKIYILIGVCLLLALLTIKLAYNLFFSFTRKSLWKTYSELKN